MNSVTPKHIDTTLALPVMEQFYTIQGEGFHQGKAAYFVRLAGCDVGCTWCDVKESWAAEDHPIMAIEDIVNNVKNTQAEIVVITGGEPLMYNLSTLTNTLKNEGFKTHIETSGAYALTGSWDWVCVSPKRFKKALPECLKAAHELKVVIAHKNDLRFAEKYAKEVSNDCHLLLQPEWSVEQQVLPEMIAFVKEHPQYRITLQTHKYMQVP